MLIVAAAPLLGGCRARSQIDYHVQVRNETSGVARLVVVRGDTDRIIHVYDTQVYPRDRAEVSLPLRPAGEVLELQVDSPNNPGTPAKMTLAPGQSIIVVRREGDEGTFNLELLQGR